MWAFVADSVHKFALHLGVGVRKTDFPSGFTVGPPGVPDPVSDVAVHIFPFWLRPFLWKDQLFRVRVVRNVWCLLTRKAHSGGVKSSVMGKRVSFE